MRRRSEKAIKIGIGFAVALGLVILWMANPLFTTLVPSRPKNGPVVVIISGDMGFHTGLGPQIGERLAKDGNMVIGVNSVHFAWHQRSPRQMANLLTQAINMALRQSGARHAVLIGQSYGADLVHVGAAYLSAATRAKVARIVLVVPTRDIYYSVGPFEYLGWRRPDATAVASAGEIDWVPLICIRGSEETDSVCPALTRANVQQIVVQGDHYLGHDADRLYRVVQPIIDGVGPV